MGEIDKDRHYHEFVELLTAEQIPLLRYLAAILGDGDAASTVLQDTNVVLLEKWEEFEQGTSFRAWSRRVAYLRALSLVRDSKRDRLVFSEETVKQIASRTETTDEVSEQRLALRHCLTHLSQSSLELVQRRYQDGFSIDRLAETSGKSASAVKVALHRIRRSLMTCIENQLSAQ